MRREFTELSEKAKNFITTNKITDLKKLKKELQTTLRLDYSISREALKYLKLSGLIETYLLHRKKEIIRGS